MSIERASNVILTVAAVVMVAILVRREFVALQPGDGGGGTALEPRRVSEAEWQAVLESAVEIEGDTSRADVTIWIVLFSDLECPACRDYHRRVMGGALEDLGEGVRLAYVHRPLRGHRFAREAAKAAECAAGQFRFREFIDVLYAIQDSIGNKPWSSYAADAQVPDSAAFQDCMSRPPPARIQSGVDVAISLGITATPTVMVNGWLFQRPLTETELATVVENLRFGRPLTSGLSASR